MIKDYKVIYTGCSLNIVFFPENFVIFLNSASTAASLVFYLPGVCTHTDIERKQSPENIFLIFNEHPVYNSSKGDTQLKLGIWTPLL